MSDPKLDPVWLDTCVVSKVFNGDKVGEYFLKLLRDDGHELLMVPAANHELLYGNPLTMDGRAVWEQQPSEATRVALEALKTRLGIKVDLSAGAIPFKTRAMYAMQGHRPQNGMERPVDRDGNLIRDVNNRVLPLKPSGHSSTLLNLSESDNLVLGQVMASAQARKVAKPIMVTAETGGKGMLTQAHLFKVTAIRVPPLGGSELGETLTPNSGGGGSSGPAGPGSSSSAPEASVSSAIKANLPMARVVKRGGLPPGTLTAISVTIGQVVVHVGAMLLLQYLSQIIMQKISKNLIDQRMKEFEPEIQRFATAYGRMIVDNVASSTPAYVTSRVRIEYPIQYMQTGAFGMDVLNTLPSTNLDALWISERDHTGENKHTLGSDIGNQTDVHEYTFSVSVGSQVTKKQLVTYRVFNSQIRLYQTALRNAVNSMASKADIQREIQDLMDALDEMFGGGFQFTPDAKLWTREGSAAMVGATGGVVYSGLPEIR
jgi:hypothetical protein